MRGQPGAAQLSWSGADAPELKHVNLPGVLVNVEAVLNQIAAIAMVDFAAHQICEKQLFLLKLGERQAQITLPAILCVVDDRNVAPIALSSPGV